MNRNLINTYGQNEVASRVDGASSHQLIQLLFEGAIKAVVRAKFAMESGQVAEKCQAISQAMAIIQDGLQLSLDVKAGGELAVNLNDLYEYMSGRLLLANANNEVQPLDEVGLLLVGLRDAWATVGGASATKPVVVDEVATRGAVSLSYGMA